MSTSHAVTKILPLSQSKFEDLACPILYTAKHIDGTQEPQNEFSLRGIQIHEALSDYVRYLVKAGKRNDLGWFEINVLSRPYLPDAMTILGEMADWFDIDPDKVLATELYLALDDTLAPIEAIGKDEYLAETGRLPDYEGTLDMVQIGQVPGGFTEAVIDDYKSYWRIIDADTFQSMFYPLLVFKHFPNVDVVRFNLRFVRYGAHAQREAVFTREDVPKLETMAREARLRQITLHVDIGSELVAMSGDHCTYCPRLRTCPLGEANRMTEEPKDVLRRALWAQELLKQDTALLKAHAAAGPLVVEDSNGQKFMAGFTERASRRYPLSVVPLVNANDPILAKKLTVSGLSTALNAKKRRALADLVAPLAEITVSTVFRIGARKDEEE